MEQTGKRLLHVLAQNFGRPLTVQEIADLSNRAFGTGHYSNTYKELQKMNAAGLIRWDHKGRSAIIQLDPGSPVLADHLIQNEAHKRLRLAAGRPDAAPKLRQLSAFLASDTALESAWLLEADRSIRLNRWPVLRLYPETVPATLSKPKGAIHADVRLELLEMTREAFRRRLASPAPEPLRSWFASATCLLGADRFWLDLLDAARAGTPLWLQPTDEDPDKDAIVASLFHYGYEEFGRPASTGPSLPIEALTLHVMRSGTPRQKKALGSILAKNPFDPALLAFVLRREGAAACADLAHILQATSPTSKATSRLAKGLIKTTVQG